MRTTLITFALATLLTPSPAQETSTVPESLLGMVGDWRLEQEDQSLPTCALTFTEDQTDAGWFITLPEPCPLPFPSPNQFHTWNIDDADGAVLIVDASGNEVLHLAEAENGLYATEPGVLPAFYLMLPYDEDGMGGEIGEDVAE
jgi:hypothetical protein